ncbi:hypothetical protein E2C01_028990 [Portunus trituberculatus]|uniref:Uncharacterized protein n=1 Tax=Portunus trituberculatus TaxID=210409 RepID=A0A5B7EQ98_PORTR|nr:hypothetical protein [Portunus trituberculatus]
MSVSPTVNECRFTPTYDKVLGVDLRGQRIYNWSYGVFRANTREVRVKVHLPARSGAERSINPVPRHLTHRRQHTTTGHTTSLHHISLTGQGVLVTLPGVNLMGGGHPGAGPVVGFFGRGTVKASFEATATWESSYTSYVLARPDSRPHSG